MPISILRDITLLSGWAFLQEQKHKQLSLGVGLFEQAVEDKLSFFFKEIFKQWSGKSCPPRSKGGKGGN